MTSKVFRGKIINWTCLFRQISIFRGMKTIIVYKIFKKFINNFLINPHKKFKEDF